MSFVKMHEARTIKKIVMWLRHPGRRLMTPEEYAECIERGDWREMKLPKKEKSK